MTPNTLHVTVEKPITLDQVPSGSGMVVLDEAIFVISDDSPSLFQLNSDFKVVRRTELTRGHEGVLRIEKPLKPDYECLALYSDDNGSLLYGFGSGSLSEKRDSLVIIDPKKESVEKHDLTQFYNLLELQTGGEKRGKLNIEGAIIHQEHLYLLNRGTNVIFKVAYDAFIRCVEGHEDLTDLEVKEFKVELPFEEGEFMGLSGCTIIPGTNNMLFTATVEATSNWIDDGEILGSYLGVLALDLLGEQQKPTLWQFEMKGKPLKDKIESITILGSKGESKYTALAIADNDDGTSKIYPLEIRINF